MAFGQCLHGAAADGGTGIVEKFGQCIGGDFRPLDFQAAGIVDFGGGGFANAVDSAEEVRFVELRGGAAEFVPAAGVDDDQ